MLGPEKQNGLYIDVGCYHPITYSNSYLFYRRGWSGIGIDPNPYKHDFWKKTRPRDIFVDFAVTKKIGEALYEMNPKYPTCNKLILIRKRKKGLITGKLKHNR
jgi:hypothetical protein